MEITRKHALSMGLPEEQIEEVVKASHSKAQGGSRLKLPQLWEPGTKFSEETRLRAKRRYMDSGTALDKFKRKRARARIREIRAILKEKQDAKDAKVAPPGSRKAYALMKKREAAQKKKDDARRREKARFAAEEAKQRAMIKSDEMEAPPDKCCYGMFTRRVKIAKADDAIKIQKAEERAAKKAAAKKLRDETKATIDAWREECRRAWEDDVEPPPKPDCYLKTRDDPSCCDYLFLRTPNGVWLKDAVRPWLVQAYEQIVEYLPKPRLGPDGLPCPPPAASTRRGAGGEAGGTRGAAGRGGGTAGEAPAGQQVAQEGQPTATLGSEESKDNEPSLPIRKFFRRRR